MQNAPQTSSKTGQNENEGKVIACVSLSNYDIYDHIFMSESVIGYGKRNACEVDAHHERAGRDHDPAPAAIAGTGQRLR